MNKKQNQKAINKNKLDAGKSPEKLLIGKINGFFNVNGWVKVFSYTNIKKNILKYQPWWYLVDNTWQKIIIINGREQGKTIVAQIKDIDNKDKAQKFLAVDLYIDKSQLPELQNQIYWHELKGMSVVNLENIKFGIVDNIVATGANDVLVVKGHKERWIPYLKPFLISVNREDKIITVDWDKDF